MGYPDFESIDFNFRRSFVTLLDFPVLILFLILGVVIFNAVRKRSNPFYGVKFNVFFGAFFLHSFASIFITLIYSYYYEGGDTTAYFNDARLLHKIFRHDPSTALDIFFSSPRTLFENHPYIFYSFRFTSAADTFMMVRICFIIQLFSFNLILPTALLFGYVSFFVSWKFYITFCNQHPSITKYLAIPIFFIPGVHVWGSGIFKDTIALILLYLIITELVNGVKGFSVIKLIACAYLLFVIKIYILMTLLLGLFVFLIVNNLARVKSLALKALLFPILFSVGFSGFFFAFKIIGDNSRRGIYSMEQILDRAAIVSNYLEYVSDKSDGSSYNLGIQEFTVPNLLSKIPAGINVTLFRPYIWEVRNPLMLAAAVESTLIFLFTIYVILKVGPHRIFTRIIKSPLVLSIFVYCLSFAFAIGVTSNNFGTLTRYKIPIIPFYVIALLLILHANRIKSYGGILRAAPLFSSQSKDKTDTIPEDKME